MRKRLSLILASFLICMSTIFCYGQNSESKLTAAQKAYILSRFCNEIKYNFAFYDQLKFNWDSLCTESMQTIVNTPTDESFLKEMQALCARLQDGHTYIFPTQNPDNVADWIRPFPMKTKRIGDKVYVTDVYSSKLQDLGIEPGYQIIKIDDEDVMDYASKHIQPFLSSSTAQWTKHRPFSEFELTKDKGSKKSRILFRDKKGKEITYEGDRNIAWDLSNNSPSTTLDILKGNIGVLKIRSFQDYDFDQSKFDDLYEQILGTDALIIDLRDNSGGNSHHSDYIISHICNNPVTQGEWKSPMYVAAHASWGMPQEWYVSTNESIQPIEGKKIYDKPIVVLVNASTFSSAENFCISFKSADRGKIVGTPTGGSTGNPIFIDLGNGIGCCICTKHELDANGHEFIGIGIQPDIFIEENDDILLKHKDNAIEKSLELLKSKREK